MKRRGGGGGIDLKGGRSKKGGGGEGDNKEREGWVVSIAGLNGMNNVHPGGGTPRQEVFILLYTYFPLRLTVILLALLFYQGPCVAPVTEMSQSLGPWIHGRSTA